VLFGFLFRNCLPMRLWPDEQMGVGLSSGRRCRGKEGKRAQAGVNRCTEYLFERAVWACAVLGAARGSDARRLLAALLGSSAVSRRLAALLRGLRRALRRRKVASSVVAFFVRLSFSWRPPAERARGRVVVGYLVFVGVSRSGVLHGRGGASWDAYRLWGCEGFEGSGV